MSKNPIGKGELNLDDLQYLIDKLEKSSSIDTPGSEQTEERTELWIPILSPHSSKQAGNLLVSLRISSC